jgi:hypothetical protein
MADFSKLINIATSPVSQTAGEMIDKAGKTSIVVGPASMVVDRVTEGGFTIAEYAALASIVVSAMWATKLLIDIIVTILKYRRGD